MDGSTDTSYNNEKAPSMGSMFDDRSHSQPASSDSSYNRPPSYGEVAHRESSAGGPDPMEIDIYSLGAVNKRRRYSLRPTSEVSDIPKTLKVAFHNRYKEEHVIHNIILLKESTVRDVLNEVKQKVILSHPNAELRLLALFNHRIHMIFPVIHEIESIHYKLKYWSLCAEEIPEEEKNVRPQDRLIYVYHFTAEVSQNQLHVRYFGEPFVLLVRENDTLGVVKIRIQRKLEVPDEEFSKWKITFYEFGIPTYLQDSDFVASRISGINSFNGWSWNVGLEHSDTTPKKFFTEI